MSNWKDELLNFIRGETASVQVLKILTAEIKRLRADNKQLLDRIMSADYTTYKTFEEPELPDTLTPYHDPSDNVGEIVDEITQNHIADK